jgi:mRNA-degrading endonuclease HigB of HigAB toxin-antitoxin module
MSRPQRFEICRLLTWGVAPRNQTKCFQPQISGKAESVHVGGNKVRIIAAIHYNQKRIYIRAVLTHEEYDKGKWKE